MFALLASYFIFAEERAREKRNTIAMVNYTDDGRVIAISQFFYGQYHIWELFGSHLGVICFRLKINFFVKTMDKGLHYGQRGGVETKVNKGTCY